jgi:hypothetical protein
MKAVMGLVQVCGEAERLGSEAGLRELRGLYREPTGIGGRLGVPAWSALVEMASDDDKDEDEAYFEGDDELDDDDDDELEDFDEFGDDDDDVVDDDEDDDDEEL